ncbi:hypothetical protein HID58_022649 [Brassica napus]|uniref:Uncharacterized protein n=1 Tax=Brassica napus TaxID=3708 RepID=A0ABQ8D053_BRANA|nr:hypothetical protein HID58_022649 [Brassica napus]
MSPELQGMIENPTTPVGLAAPVRPRKIRESKRVRDSEEPDASSEVDPLAGVRKTPRGPILRSRLQGRSTGMMVDPLSIAIPAAEDQVAPEALAGSIGDRPQRTRKFDLSAHRAQRQVFKSVVSASLSSSVPGIPSQGRVSGEGGSDPRGSRTDCIHLAQAKTKELRASSLDKMVERDAYIRVAATVASNEYAALMEMRLYDFLNTEEEIEEIKGKLLLADKEKFGLEGDLMSMREKCKREINGREVAVRRACRLARRALIQEYDTILGLVRAKFLKKKEETAAEIRLQEVRARIEALSENKEGGFEIDEELARLKDKEIEFNIDYGAAVVSDPSLDCIDLPQT